VSNRFTKFGEQAIRFDLDPPYSGYVFLHSPIEVKMLRALVGRAYEWDGVMFRKGLATIQPAKKITYDYEVDFLVSHATVEWLEGLRGIVVECDGAAYHSTEQQRRNDNVRDEALKRAGFYSMHFTGSEICRSAHSCARTVWAKWTDIFIR